MNMKDKQEKKPTVGGKTTQKYHEFLGQRLCGWFTSQTGLAFGASLVEGITD